MPPRDASANLLDLPTDTQLLASVLGFGGEELSTNLQESLDRMRPVDRQHSLDCLANLVTSSEIIVNYDSIQELIGQELAELVFQEMINVTLAGETTENSFDQASGNQYTDNTQSATKNNNEPLANQGNVQQNMQSQVIRDVLYGVRQDLSWQEQAICSQTDPEAFYPGKGGSTREAKRVCLKCEVRKDCLDYAIDTEERFGVWGGLSERERRRLRKNRKST